MLTILRSLALILGTTILVTVGFVGVHSFQPTIAFYTDDERSTANSISAGDWTPPAPPNGLTIMNEDGMDLGCDGVTRERPVTLTWDDNSEADFAYYQYDVSDQDNLLQLLVSQFSETIPNEDGLYRYRVRAVDESGNISKPTDWCDVYLNRNDGPGTVVINEVMWMGSQGHSADEWLELHNTTAAPIDLSLWQITNLGTAGNPDIFIPNGMSLAADGFFLLANEASSSADSALDVPVDLVDLTVSVVNTPSEQLTLVDHDAEVIDQTPVASTSWAAGSSTPSIKQSMERNDTPGDGTDAANWHTCTDEACNDGVFWDGDNGANYGTPGSPNLSDEGLVLRVTYQPDAYRLSFVVDQLAQYLVLTYHLNYRLEDVTQQIGPTDVALNSQDQYLSPEFMLSTCSFDSLETACIEPETIHDLEVVVKLGGGQQTLVWGEED